jgi:diguanylate cyclase
MTDNAVGRFAQSSSNCDGAPRGYTGRRCSALASPRHTGRNVTATSTNGADLLRQVLKLMTAHAEDYRPLTYTVWYEYALQGDKQLCARLAQAVASGERLSSEATDELYSRHLVGRRQQIINNAQATILQALENMSSAIGEAHDNTGRFAGHLKEFTDETARPLSQEIFGASVRVIADQARRSGEELARVQVRLQDSEAQVKRMAEDLAQIRSEVYVDALSGLFNRRRFDSALESLVAKASSDNEPFSMLLIDIDEFKGINDRHGHVFGDQVIQCVSQAIKASVKGRDIAARYGGDEFAVLLPETALAGATTVAEYIRRIIERRRLSDYIGEGETVTVTVSVGLATLGAGETGQSLLRRADKALYQAKKNGRNQVIAD